MIYAITIVIVAAIILVIHRTRPKTQPEKTGLVAIDAKKVLWKSNESDLGSSLINLRLEKGLKRLQSNFDLKKISQERVAFWKHEGYTNRDNLHSYWLGVEKDLVDRGIFASVYECCEYGITNPLDTFLNSPTHRKALLGDYRYTAVTVDGKYCCWLFAN